MSLFDACCTCGSVRPGGTGSYVMMRNNAIFILSVLIVPFPRGNVRSHVIPENNVVTKRDRW